MGPPDRATVKCSARSDTVSSVIAGMAHSTMASSAVLAGMVHMKESEAKSAPVPVAVAARSEVRPAG